MLHLTLPETGKILLAVDGSHPSSSAARAAAWIAKSLHWSIHAVYVVDAAQVFEMYGDTTPELSEFGTQVPDEQQFDLFKEQGLLALAEVESLCQLVDVPVTTELIFGGVPHVVLESARQYQLLALGRRGNRHENVSQHLGSNFRQIAHHAHCPLLIGGNNSNHNKCQHLLLAYDGSTLSKQALTWADDLGTKCRDILVLSVEKEYEKDHTWLEDRQLEIERSGVKPNEFIRGGGDPRRSIVAIASSRQADLILMGAYHHAQFMEWTNHSVLDSVLRESDIPILAMK